MNLIITRVPLELMARNQLRQIVYRVRKPLLSLMSLCLALLTAEIAVRFLFDVPRIHVIAVSEIESPYKRSSNPILGYELKPNFRASHRNGIIQTNEHGHRDRPRHYEKAKGVRRVIMLGDSVVESVNLLTDEDTINIQLEELFPDHDTEVLNLAVAGYRTRAEVELLRVEGLKYQPDIVVVVFVENDFQNFNPQHAFDNRIVERPLGVNGLFRHSHFFRLLCVRMNWFDFNNKDNSESWNQQALGDNNVAEGFSLLRELADRYDFDLIVGIWPAFTDTAVVDRHVMRGDQDHLVVEHLAWSNGIPTFRFSPHFRRDWETGTETRNGDSPKRYYTVEADGMHPSPPATRIAARALHAVLTGLQSTEIQETPSDATDIASGLGTPKEPPDPLLTRRPAYAVLLKQNRQREAEAYVQRLLEDDPSDADAWCLKAGSDGARGDFEKATLYYDHALSIDPQHVEALVWRGVLAYTTDQTDSAIEYFRRALKQDPDHARACFYLGLAYTRTSPAQAATYFRRAADRFPGYVDAHHELAKLFLSINEPEQAAEACRIAIGFEQDNAEAHFHLGVSYVMQRQFDKAVTSFDDAIRLQPEFAEAHLACSDAWQRQGEIESAILHLRRAIELRPEWFDPTAKLAWLLATGNDEKLRDGKEAVRLALKCLQQIESYQTLDVLAAAHAEAGEYESAVKRQKQAVAQAPEEVKTSLESRLEQYNNRQPHRR